MLLSTVYNPDLDFIIAPPVVPQWADLPWFCVCTAALLGQVFHKRIFLIANTGIDWGGGLFQHCVFWSFGVKIGDAMPDTTSLIGIVLIIMSGVVISMQK